MLRSYLWVAQINAVAVDSGIPVILMTYENDGKLWFLQIATFLANSQLFLDKSQLLNYDFGYKIITCEQKV